MQRNTPLSLRNGEKFFIFTEKLFTNLYFLSRDIWKLLVFNISNNHGWQPFIPKFKSRINTDPYKSVTSFLEEPHLKLRIIIRICEAPDSRGNGKLGPRKWGSQFARSETRSPNCLTRQPYWLEHRYSLNGSNKVMMNLNQKQAVPSKTNLLPNWKFQWSLFWVVRVVSQFL